MAAPVAVVVAEVELDTAWGVLLGLCVGVTAAKCAVVAAAMVVFFFVVVVVMIAVVVVVVVVVVVMVSSWSLRLCLVWWLVWLSLWLP